MNQCLKNQFSKNNRLRMSCLLFSCFLLSSGCVKVSHVIDPSTHREKERLGATDISYGTPYSYEHKIAGDLFLRRGEIGEAVEAYEHAIAGDPRDFSLRVHLANGLLRKGDLIRARFHIAKAILLYPKNGEAWYIAALIHQKNGDSQKAVHAAVHGYQVDRDNVSCLIWLAEHYRYSNNQSVKKKALHYYQLALVRCHTDLDLVLEAGTLCFELQYNELAIQYFERYLSMFGEDTDAVLHVVNAYQEMKNTSAAITLLKKMMSRNSRNDDMRTALVNLYLESKQYQQAVSHILSLQNEPVTPELIVQRTGWLLEAHAPWDARTMLVEYFSSVPLHPAVRLQLAKIEVALLRNEIALILLVHPEGKWPPEYEEEVQTYQGLLTD